MESRDKGIEHVNMKNFYRADIDGMRAIAIISVVIFHMAPKGFPGGFAGVDVFFVISGYLITSIILKQLKDGTFSFSEFYIKRVIRLFPSLLVVLLATLLFGWYILLPHEFKQLGKHVASGAGFVANIAYYFETGYFNNDSELKPLLHLWSLGIEEQFYFFWPLFLFLAWKYLPKFLPWLICGLILYSFGINMQKISRNPEFAFFMPQTRFWELIIGGFLAWMESKNLRMLSETGKTRASLAGFTLCFLSFFLLREHAFPGYWALLPVLGTSLMISGGDTWLNKNILTWRPLVFIGLISYPLYLWHWPLLSFSQIMYNASAPLTVRILLVITAFILATLTYLYLEKPLKVLKSRSRNFTSLVFVSSIAVSGIAGYLVLIQQVSPLSARFGFASLSAALGDWNYPGNLETKIMNGNRYFYQGQVPATTVFIGDSNMEQYYPRVEKILNEHKDKIGVIFVTAGGCPPLPEVKHDGKYQFCSDWVENGFRLAEDIHVKNVVIAGQWTSYLSKERNFFFMVKDKRAELSNKGEGLNKAISTLSSRISSLRKLGKNVFVIMNIPVGSELSPDGLISRSLMWPPIRFRTQYYSLSKFEKKFEDYFKNLEDSVKAAGATVINPRDFLCDKVTDQCLRITEDGRPIYKDSSHLRPFFVRERVKYLDKTLL